LFLEPSIGYCARFLNFTPDIVVGDMAYINLSVHRRLRERFNVAMITKWRPDMLMPDAFDTPTRMSCEHGQRLHWLGLEARDQLHWFGVLDLIRFVRTVGSRAAARGSSRMRRPSMRFSMAPFLPAAALRNGCFINAVLGLRPPKPTTNINWDWATIF
jgi:hypothetical protein